MIVDFLDIETSSLSENDIIQVCIVRTDNGIIKQVYNKYFKNVIPISEGAYNIHKISEEFLKELGVPVVDECIDEIYDILSSSDLICGFNPTFDLLNINNILVYNFKMPIECKYLDLMILYTNKYYNDFSRDNKFISLTKATNKFLSSEQIQNIQKSYELYNKISPNHAEGFHDALYDCLCCVELFKNFAFKKV